MEKQTIVNQDKGYIKLYKNTKGYNWEVKMYEGKLAKEFEELMKQLEEVNSEMLDKFGEQI